MFRRLVVAIALVVSWSPSNSFGADQDACACAPCCRRCGQRRRTCCCQVHDDGCRHETRSADTNVRALPTRPTLTSHVFAFPVIPVVAWAPFEENLLRDEDNVRCKRIDELDARVEALNLRMKTVQRTIEIQTTILEEIRAAGTIGGQPIPGRKPTVTPAKSSEPSGTNVSESKAESEAEIQAAAKNQLEWTQQSLQELLDQLPVESSDPKIKAQRELFENVLKQISERTKANPPAN